MLPSHAFLIYFSVLSLSTSQKTKSGLVIPEKAQEKVKEAKVVAVGAGGRNKVNCLLVLLITSLLPHYCCYTASYIPHYLPIALGFTSPLQCYTIYSYYGSCCVFVLLIPNPVFNP